MTDQGLAASTGGADARTRTNVAIWAAMLVIGALEVTVTYARPRVSLLLAALLVLAAVQATLGVLYFMHLRHERPVLAWSLVSALLFVLAMLNQLWPDAMRLLRLRLHE